MGWADGLKGLVAPLLANKQSKALQAAAAKKTDAMRQHDYDTARRSMLGDFSSKPPSWLQNCLAQAKAVRREQRLDLVSRAVVACPDHADAAARLREDMDEVENMRCAKHVYIANDPLAPVDLRAAPPPGFKNATADDLAGMGLTQDMLTPEGSQFRAAVYMKDEAVWGPDPKPAAVVAFRGSTPAKEDWDNNFAQDANQDAPYYRKAVQIGNTLAENEASAHIVGHSLGGGMASAAQGGSGLTASTYNAAGLHPSTVAKYSGDASHQAADAGKIKAMRIKGEVLTQTQESDWGTSWVANEAVGQRTDLDASHGKADFEALKRRGLVDAKDDYKTYLHGMDEVIDSMEQRKTADEAALKGCLQGQG
ncbi:MAG: hypothetical protein C0505_16550 [Leptothrix sp. (in: Bacteria)]|nr:hypothetical protein [Leptothrix sp. (in: b-proteobacteria)]